MLEDRPRRSDLVARSAATLLGLVGRPSLARRLVRGVAARRLFGISSAAALLDSFIDFFDLLGRTTKLELEELPVPAVPRTTLTPVLLLPAAAEQQPVPQPEEVVTTDLDEPGHSPPRPPVIQVPEDGWDDWDDTDALIEGCITAMLEAEDALGASESTLPLAATHDAEFLINDLIAGWIAAAAIESAWARPSDHASNASPAVEVEELEGPPAPAVELFAAEEPAVEVEELEGPPAPAVELFAAGEPAVEVEELEGPPAPAVCPVPAQEVTPIVVSTFMRRPQARVRPGRRRPAQSQLDGRAILPSSRAAAFPVSSMVPLSVTAPDASSAWQRRPDAARSPRVLLCAAPGAPLRPPAALAHLATYARTQGVPVEVLDFNLDLARRLGPSWSPIWRDPGLCCFSDHARCSILLDLVAPHLDAYATLLSDHAAPLLAFSVTSARQPCTLELIKRVKARAPHKRVLLGGPGCVTPEGRRALLDASPVPLDGFALGEGEQLLCDAVAALEAGQELGKVAGVLACQEGSETICSRRKRLLPLDRVPFPRYEDFDLHRYPAEAELTVEWSRGCIGACTFCQEKAIDGRYRSHSALAIVSALRRYVRDLGVRCFQVCDPLINGDVLVLGEICRRLSTERLDIEWRGQAVPSRSLTPELLRSMRRAGCTELRLGLESAADAVLYRMNKRRLFSAADASEVIRACHAAGIRTSVSFMVGFVGEGEREFQRSCDFLREHAAQIDELASVTPLQLIPDTPLSTQAVAYGIRTPEGAGPGGWIAADNTPELRQERAARLLALAGEMGLPAGHREFAETAAVAADSAPVVGWSGGCRPPELLERLLGNAAGLDVIPPSSQPTA